MTYKFHISVTEDSEKVMDLHVVASTMFEMKFQASSSPRHQMKRSIGPEIIC